MIMILFHADVGTACTLTPDTAFGRAETIDLLPVFASVHFITINNCRVL